MRDEVVVNRGYTLPPYYQTEWAFNKNPYWTPAQLNGLETWFSPEYFHPETTDTTKCLEMENRANGTHAGGDAQAMSAPAGMADFVTDTDRHRGLSALYADGGSAYLLDNATDWNTSTYDWFCCIMLHGPSDSSLDNIQNIAGKGARWSFTHDWSGSNKNAVFTYSEGSSGTNSGSLTLVGSSQIQSTRPTIYTFGRKRGDMFLRCIRHNTVTIAEETEDGWEDRDLDAVAKPKLFGNIPYLGTSTLYNGEFVELIFTRDSVTITEAQNNIERAEGYLAHKYGVSKLLYQTDHQYYLDPPRI
jgi:hypothetical protein